MKLNCIVFGFGRIGKLHIDNILKYPKKFYLLYIITPIKKTDNYKNVPFADIDSYKQILLNEKIDCAFICSPTKFHYIQTIDCLSNNINVFCEKPLSNNLDEIQNIYKLSERNKLKVFVGFNRRFDPQIKKLFDKYRNGDINKLNQIYINSRDYPLVPNNYINNNSNFHFDSIIHDIDTTNWIIGETPIKVFSYSDSNNKNVTTILIYKSDITVNILSSRIHNNYKQDIELYGNKKSIRNNNEYIYYSYEDRYYNSYINELNEFYLDIVNNREPLISKEDIINNFLVCSNCIKSLEQQKLITLNLPKLFRNYENCNNNVIETYLQQRKFHNIEFYDYCINKYCNFNNKNSFWELFDILKEFVDLSDPDINLSNQHHLFQTAEAIRKDGLPKWFQLIGLIHDLGKIIFKKGTQDDGTSLDKQYSIVGDTFILGCPIPDTIVFNEFNLFNSYYRNNNIKNKKYNLLNLKEKLGIYSQNCGFKNVKCSFGHDEYLYRLLKHNKVNLPKQAYYIIRFHSLYLWHSENEYSFLEDETDKEMKWWVYLFQKYDLYTKINIQKNENELKKYYTDLVNYYLPNTIEW